MKLRPYQEEAITGILNTLREHDTCLVVMPTGTGKTVVFSKLLEMATKGRGMVVAHREELINQACEKICSVTGTRPDIEMASQCADDTVKTPVVVSSVQTQCSGGKSPRMEKFIPSQFTLLILDEAHHATAKSWQRVVKHYRQNENLKVVGFTATPDRLDKMALGNIFEHVAYEYHIDDAIRDGYLVPIKQRMVEVDCLDYSSIRTTAGDLNGRELAQVMEDEHVLHEVASPTVELLNGRKALLFASSVNHAQRLSEIFERYNLTSAYVSGKTPKSERAKIVKDFASGEIRVLCNVGCFTEGFDDPAVEVVVMARPTKSRALYSQMVGRGTRPLAGIVDNLSVDTPEERRKAIKNSGKKVVEVIDFSGNCGRHKLVNCMSILGGKDISDDVLQRANELAVGKDAPVDPRRIVEEAEEEIIAERERKRVEAMAKRAKLRAKVKFDTKAVNPFDTFDIHIPVENEQYERGATDKQIDFLAKHHIDAESYTFKQASKVTTTIITRLKKGLSTPKQISTLRKYGVEAKDMTKKEASEHLDRIASNGWRNP